MSSLCGAVAHHGDERIDGVHQHGIVARGQTVVRDHEQIDRPQRVIRGDEFGLDVPGQVAATQEFKSSLVWRGFAPSSVATQSELRFPPRNLVHRSSATADFATPASQDARASWEINGGSPVSARLAKTSPMLFIGRPSIRSSI